VNVVTTWTPEELDRVGQAEQLQLATPRRQGSLSRYVTMWGDIDAAYHHAKYDRYGPRIVGSVTGRDTHPLTVRLAKAGRQETRYS
jgi:hypothetical protein